MITLYGLALIFAVVCTRGNFHECRFRLCYPYRVGKIRQYTQGWPTPLGCGQPWALLFNLFEVSATR